MLIPSINQKNHHTSPTNSCNSGCLIPIVQPTHRLKQKHLKKQSPSVRSDTEPEGKAVESICAADFLLHFNSANF
jgi:hypothetical protein